MLEASRTPGINLLTYSEVEDVSGFVGNFNVKIRKKARYIKNDCNGCGACTEVCPVYGYDELRTGREGQRTLGAANGDHLVLIGLAQHLQCALSKFGQLIQEQHAPMGEAHFARRG